MPLLPASVSLQASPIALPNMDFADRISGAFAGARPHSAPSNKTLLSFTPLSHGAQEHLVQV